MDSLPHTYYIFGGIQVSSVVSMACTRCSPHRVPTGPTPNHVRPGKSRLFFVRQFDAPQRQPQRNRPTRTAPPLVSAGPTAGCNPTRQCQRDARTEARVSRGGR
jgi:hypothetical protein